MTILVLGLLVVIGTVAYIALRNARDFSDANEVIPGVPTNAPKSWAGAHNAEARLHRRLRDAMTALRTNASLDDAAMAPMRAALERHALAVDDHLVAAASLPARHRDEPVRRVGEAVDAIEAAVADVAALRGPEISDLALGVDSVRTRLELVADARRELEALGPGTSGSSFGTSRGDHGGPEPGAAAQDPATARPPDDDEPRPDAGPSTA